MILPSIDLQGGNAVQLVGGREKALDAGDPFSVAERFAAVGPIAVVDLDAALGQGSNAGLMKQLCQRFRCRVGGGIRDLETARRWLDAGAEKIVIGTAAEPELLRQLPPGRVVVALDAEDGEVVVEGWRRKTGRGIAERMGELSGLCSGFLVTFVEREGRLGGTDLQRVAELVQAAGKARLTIAGGVTTAEEVAELDRLGADAQVGMSLYTGRLSLAQAFAAPLVSEREDGLWPTVVVDELGTALGLCWSNAESLELALEERRGVYWSRRRGLWRKGESSGATQELLRVDVDCDRDALRFSVRQRAGFCHTGTRSCWGESQGLGQLERTLRERRVEAPGGSYTRRLFEDTELLRAKLLEEAGELAEARGLRDVRGETADVVYFALAAMVRAGVRLEDVAHELDRRSLRVTRRPGNAKPEASAR